jgi:hypothetical protein
LDLLFKVIGEVNDFVPKINVAIMLVITNMNQTGMFHLYLSFASLMLQQDSFSL